MGGDYRGCLTPALGPGYEIADSRYMAALAAS
jgi:hypothetical protein